MISEKRCQAFWYFFNYHAHVIKAQYSSIDLFGSFFLCKLNAKSNQAKQARETV